MFVQFLGLLDLFAASFIGLHAHLPSHLMLFVALVLAGKGMLFLLFGDAMSLVDICIALYCVVLALGVSYFLLTLIAVVYLFQKGMMSFA